jgi:hypothetical protein
MNTSKRRFTDRPLTPASGGWGFRFCARHPVLPKFARADAVQKTGTKKFVESTRGIATFWPTRRFGKLSARAAAASLIAQPLCRPGSSFFLHPSPVCNGGHESKAQAALERADVPEMTTTPGAFGSLFFALLDRASGDASD